MVTTGTIEVIAEGLGHPEGPDVLPDGRVVFANTYKSEASVWEAGKGVSTYAFTGGGPNACMLGTDGYVYIPEVYEVADIVHVISRGRLSAPFEVAGFADMEALAKAVANLETHGGT